MKKEKAEQIVSEYMNQIFSYVSKRVSNEQDRYDLVQNICLQLYHSFCIKEIRQPEHYIWVVAKHCLVNYYRDVSKQNLKGIEMPTEIIDTSIGMLDKAVVDENIQKLQEEIAYLSKTQRTILIQYYYEEKKQSEIAEFLKLPIGTVKWHLNVAKQELRKGMDKMREASELKFNPIVFEKIGMSGSEGILGSASNMFRSALSQNIVYSIYHQEKTVNEIAESLGVSPVYVESELEFLEGMSLVSVEGKKYSANILIEEIDEGSLWFQYQKELYPEISAEIGDRLYDFIIESGCLSSDSIIGIKDRNMILWSLIFYLMTWEENPDEKKILFEEAADIRADGGQNIIQAIVKNESMSEYYAEIGMDKFVGPCWNGQKLENCFAILWLLDGAWTEHRVIEHYGGLNIAGELNSLIHFYQGDNLHSEEYATLIQKGYIRKDKKGKYKFTMPVLKMGSVRDELLAKAKCIKEEVYCKNEKKIEEYKRNLLKTVPKNVKKQQEYFVQNIFKTSDSWMVLYAVKALVESGKLVMPKESEKMYVSRMLIVGENKD